MGNGTTLGMLAEMLAAGFNPNMGGGEHVGIYVERQVLDWTRRLPRVSPEASGLLGERRLDGEPGGPRRRAQCAGRLRCAP